MVVIDGEGMRGGGRRSVYRWVMGLDHGVQESYLRRLLSRFATVMMND
jgi:hypothetical protein